MGAQRVIPMFSYEDVGRAADWIAEAFGFTETGRWSDDEGRVTHVNMELDGGMVMLGWPSADYRNPKHHAEECEQARKWSQTPFVVDGVHVSVRDIDAHFAHGARGGGQDPVRARRKCRNRPAAVPRGGRRRAPLDVRGADGARNLTSPQRIRDLPRRPLSSGPGSVVRVRGLSRDTTCRAGSALSRGDREFVPEV